MKPSPSHRAIRCLLAAGVLSLGLAGGVHAQPQASSAAASTGPYVPGADANAEIRTAQAQAAATGTRVLVVFGANWCPDCRVLELALKRGATADLVQRAFQVVKVDVGKFTANLDIAQRYGVPLKQGIPAVAVLNGKGEAVYVTRAGELADARRMGEDGIRDFLRPLADGHR